MSGSPVVAARSLMAFPYRGLDAGMEMNTRLIQHMVDHPQWFATGGTPEEIRLHVAWMLTTPDWWKWEIWSGSTFVGMFLISDITPRTDAHFHFTLLPAKESGVTLTGSRKLMWNFLGYVFEQFQLQRISVEIPETSSKLAHWFRHKLGFQYEGEPTTDRLQKWRGATILDKQGAPAWIASQGSRRERAHWDGTKWADLTLLRILKDEYTARARGEVPQATSETPTSDSHNAASSEARRVQTDAADGSVGGHPQATAGG